jgi:NhaA family Na+:H+ antiporter
MPIHGPSNRVADVTPAEWLARPFRDFGRIEASAGILLLCCTVAALLWANSPKAHLYFALAGSNLAVSLGPWTLSEPLLLWINDGLMAIFFFVMGLEIKREVLVGELSSPRKAALPILAALGGMIAPAGIYAFLNAGTAASAGWGIPMATDIAFAIGVLTLFGSRIPTGLKVFLVALAIADDLGAVLVIAFFYSSGLHHGALYAAAGFLVLLVAANWARVSAPLVYALLGVGLWLAVLESGVHPTVAGVLLALTIPTRSRIDGEAFVARNRSNLSAFERHSLPGKNVLTNAGQQEALHAVREACRQAAPPAHRMEHALHPWVMYLVMPVFAFFNAGVAFEGSLSKALSQPASLGVFLGLVVGKPVGITLFSWIAVRLRWAALPDHVGWRHIAGAACIGGIGFTMSLFIAGLAFEGPLLAAGKIGILVASATAAAIGALVLRVATGRGGAAAGTRPRR